jgi:hypothetical protein
MRLVVPLPQPEVTLVRRRRREIIAPPPDAGSKNDGTTIDPGVVLLAMRLFAAYAVVFAGRVSSDVGLVIAPLSNEVTGTGLWSDAIATGELFAMLAWPTSGTVPIVLCTPVPSMTSIVGI